MISKKDLSEAEMDTLTKSCSPTIVQNRQWWSGKRKKRQLCMSKELGNVLDNEIPRETRQQYYRSESFAMKTGIPTNGSMVKKKKTSH